MDEYVKNRVLRVRFSVNVYRTIAPLLSLCLVLRVEDQLRESELESRVCVPGPLRVPMLSCERPVLRVLVADDHELTRFSLKMALRSHSGIELVAIATNGLEAVEYARVFCPDVVILDLQMPIMDGLSAAGKIKSLCPGIQILAYSSLEDSRVDQLLRDSVIDSICRKDTATSEIISRVKLLGKPFLVEYPVF